MNPVQEGALSLVDFVTEACLGVSTLASAAMDAAEVPSEAGKNLCACMSCKLVKTFSQVSSVNIWFQSQASLASAASAIAGTCITSHSYTAVCEYCSL